MNTYAKYCPNVYVAKCTEQHEKGSIIAVTTKYGKENPSIVFNLVAQKDGFFYYSIIREDGFNAQEWAKRKADRWNSRAAKAETKSTEFYQKSKKDSGFLSLMEPIKVGHHSEKRHRNILQQAWDNMGKSVEFSNKVEDYETRAAYWESKQNTVNLSMPESIEFYEYELEKATKAHQDIKSGVVAKGHSFSLTYAKKKVNEMTANVKTAHLLWGDNE